MNNAGHGDDFISWVAVKIQLGDFLANPQTDRPDMDSRKSERELLRADIDRNSLQLG